MIWFRDDNGFTAAGITVLLLISAIEAGLIAFFLMKTVGIQ